MTHLGTQLSALVDGQLSPVAADRALAHVAACRQCAEELAQARAARTALTCAGEVCPGPELTARLLALGGMNRQPAREPRDGGALGSSSPRLPGSEPRLPSGAMGRGIVRRRVALGPWVTAVAGAGLVAGLFIVGGQPSFTPQTRPGVALSALGSAASAVTMRLDHSGASAAVETVNDVDDPRLDAWYGAHPWSVEVEVPEGHVVSAVHAQDDTLEVDMVGPDGIVVLTETRGQLATGPTESVEVAGRVVQVLGQAPWCLAWQSGDAVVVVTVEGPRWAAEPIVATYPVEAYDAGAGARVSRGWRVLVSAWSTS